eukprot:m.30518 g.30518  ORF g.30518 m.30518 type:complete len:279 (+) comp6804_c0_seq1:423-1259(+)
MSTAQVAIGMGLVGAAIGYYFAVLSQPPVAVTPQPMASSVGCPPKSSARSDQLPEHVCSAAFDQAVVSAKKLHGEFLMMNSILPKLAAARTKCGGVFVELGANDGTNSHSLFLERQLGWRGVCIEAAPGNYAKLNASRPLCDKMNAVVWHKHETVTFRACTGKLYGHSGLLSMRKKSEWDSLMAAHKGKFECVDHEIAAKPAASLLKDYPVIDWFFLDVEGAEMFILKAWEWDKPPLIRHWSIESNKLDRDALVDFMQAKNYECVHVDKINTLCTHRR